jgi:hypothetical protein
MPDESPSAQKDRQERKKPGPRGLLRVPEAWIVASSAVSLILVWPLRETLATAAPWLLFLGTMVLFMVPGLTLTYLTLERSFPVAARIPLAFTLSVFLFGLPAVPALTLHWSLGTYLLVCGFILLASVVLALFLVSRRGMSSRGEMSFTVDSVGRWLMWAPLLLLVAVFAVISATGTIKIGDEWIYLAYVQDFVSPGGLAAREPFYGGPASFTRIQMSGWLLEHAAFSQLSGIEPVNLTLNYLPPALTAIAVIAFYPLAKALLEDGRAAVLATTLNALLPIYSYLLHFGPVPFNTLFFVTIVMDKVAVRYIFLPVAMAMAIWFLKERKLRYLVLFALLCWSVMLVHPIGLVVICFVLAGLGLGYLAFNWRERSTWTGLASLALGPLAVVLPVAAYVVATGTSLIELRGSISNYYPTDPSAIGYMAFTQGRIMGLDGGSFILNPNNLLMWLTIAAYLGIPFLVWQARHSVAAQMMLGAMVFITPLIFFPPLATFVGTYIGPSQLLRLHWVIELTVPIILGWMLWALISYLGNRLSRFRATRDLAPFLPLAAAGILVAGSLYFAAPEIKAHLARSAASSEGRAAASNASCLHPVYGWMKENITEPSVVLARDRENICIPVHSANANLVSLRGGMLIRNQELLEERSSQEITIPQRAVDAQKFATKRTVDEELIRILERYEVDYVLVGKPPLERAIERDLEKGSSGFTKMDTPGKGYSLYKVNLQKLEPGT